MSPASSRTNSASDRDARRRELLRSILTQRARGLHWTDSQLRARYPDEWPWLGKELDKLRQIDAALDRVERGCLRTARDGLPDDGALPATSGTTTRGAAAVPAAAGEEPESLAGVRRIGRFECRELLGQGGFGRVYRAWDSTLGRDVAIKVPHRHRLSRPRDRESFLSEARTLARMDHPAIVPVYDVGRTEDGACYVVSKWIHGSDLATRLGSSRLDPCEAARIVQGVAEALDYAHRQGVVHRDIKPANILLDQQQRPHVADFGLAVRAAEPADALTLAGTPQYMSPEMVRGESHRIDGRSDLFSLGVVLYEMLTGVRPFEADQPEQLFDQILHREVRPPRQLEGGVPAGLERICLKLLAKRAADRYATAHDLTEDLRHFLAGGGSGDARDGIGRARKIVPKGLRAFDANDAEFFLDLLPGPQDRWGLPESIRHWKTRIEATDLDDTFAVGVVYGPSGCGKSSLVRAGLLPRLSSRILTVYLEASADDTESRLRRRLAERWPVLPARQGLAECLAQFRRGQVVSEPHKLLLVIDQFEQWLHGRDDAGRRELVEALRHCDGVHVQCLLLVRDDFWLGVSRFLDELEVPLLQGKNMALVDLFDLRHARRVLTDFGRAYGCLPLDGCDVDTDTAAFIDRAVAGLSEEGKVIPVRLALFAEMVKARRWTLETLDAVGGAEGVGVAYLEETFCARGASPQTRLHERAARAVLESLLPESGSPIKGHTRSYPELLDVSGYGTNPRAFKELMRILDADTRLLTPTDPPVGDPWQGGPRPGLRYFQLTHDYLVPSLRSWLTKKQQSTRRGRAELRLAERARLWNARPEPRQLPSLWEWMTIRLLTPSGLWTLPQRRMMHVAARRHGTILAACVSLLLVLLLAGTEATSLAREAFAWLRVRTAPVWLAFGRDEAIWPLLQRTPDPTMRTQLLHRLSYLLIDPQDLLQQQAGQDDVSVRRAMILAAGEMGTALPGSTLSLALRRTEPPPELVDQLLELYRDDTDPGVHAAAEWALRRHRQEGVIDRSAAQLALERDRGDRQWYMTPNRHTMVVIPGPVRYVMGSPLSEAGRGDDERAHPAHLRRSYSIASKETTVEQFQRFLADQPQWGHGTETLPESVAEAPQTNVSWFQAAAYCNWLSAQEGIPASQWCYLPLAERGNAGAMVVAADFEELRGYRLPTEAEWEYACRAGAATPWYFGRSTEYLGEYVVGAAAGRTRPLEVGWRKPNDFGLFDMLGNAAEWCQDRGSVEPAPDAGRDGGAEAPGRDARVVRGGSFEDLPENTRCAARRPRPPHSIGAALGFRVARSYP